MDNLDATAAAGPLPAVIRAVAGGPDLGATLDVVLRSVVDELGAALALIVTTDEDPSRRHVLRSLGLTDDARLVIEAVPAGPGDILTRAAAEQHAVSATSPATGEAGSIEADALVDRLGLARLRALPLVIGPEGIDRAVGVLAVGWTAGSPMGLAPTDAADALADLAALAIDRSQLAAGLAERAAWMERLAHIDPLTGLANRRTFDRVLDLEIARAARQQSEVAVAVFDVDAFQATNVEAGREVGDDLLRAVAAVIAEQVRLVDTVARIGGDEFVVIAPGTGGPAVADRVIRAIRALPAIGGRPVSVSAGLARFPVDGASGDELIAGALDALELARTGGHGAIASVLPPS